MTTPSPGGGAGGVAPSKQHDPVVKFDLPAGAEPPPPAGPLSSRSPRRADPSVEAVDAPVDPCGDFGGIDSAVAAIMDPDPPEGPEDSPSHAAWTSPREGAAGPRSSGSSSEPVPRSASAAHGLSLGIGLGPPLPIARAPGRDAASQPVSRSASHLSGLGPPPGSARAAPVVPKSASAAGSLGSIWAMTTGEVGGDTAGAAAEPTGITSAPWPSSPEWTAVPHSATSIGIMWPSSLASGSDMDLRAAAPRSASALTNLGGHWTGASLASGRPTEADPDPSLDPGGPPAPAGPVAAPGLIPRVAPVEFAALGGGGGGLVTSTAGYFSDRASPRPVGSPLGAVSSRTCDGAGAVPQGSPLGAPRREEPKGPVSVLQHIQVLSDRVEPGRAIEQGYYLTPQHDPKPSKSKSRGGGGNPGEPKSISCLPTYTYDYGTDIEPGVWDILRSTMNRRS